MKISLKLITAILITFSCFSASYGQEEWQDIEQHEKSVAFLGRDGSLYNRRYNKADSIKYTGHFKTKYYYYNNGNPQLLEDCNIQAKIGSVKKLYDEAKAITGYNSSEDFTAVKVFYGMEGKKLIMIFQPIILEKTQDSYNGGYYYTHTKKSPNYYRLNEDGTLLRLTNEQYDFLVKTYRENIWSNGHKYTQYQDIDYCILLLQDIIEVYLHNKKTAEPDTNAMIIFSFVASIMITNDPDYKQHVVVYHRMGLLDFDGEHKFRSFGADYSQLCPPQCDKNIWIYTDN